jgi:hypothetical protein
MIGASKILTVSYGTFSCTLEGFDDPFNTMKAIAEYFRDLAADDRYFGAEPPTPDAAMLSRIAEREIHRRVEAKVDDTGVVLRAAETPTPQPMPAPQPAPAPGLLAEESVAAKLQRIRSAVARSAALAAAAPAPVIEDAVVADEDDSTPFPPAADPTDSLRDQWQAIDMAAEAAQDEAEAAEALSTESDLREVFETVVVPEVVTEATPEPEIEVADLAQPDIDAALPEDFAEPTRDDLPEDSAPEAATTAEDDALIASLSQTYEPAEDRADEQAAIEDEAVDAQMSSVLASLSDTAAKASDEDTDDQIAVPADVTPYAEAPAARNAHEDDEDLDAALAAALDAPLAQVARPVPPVEDNYDDEFEDLVEAAPANWQDASDTQDDAADAADPVAAEDRLMTYSDDVPDPAPAAWPADPEAPAAEAEAAPELSDKLRRARARVIKVRRPEPLILTNEAPVITEAAHAEDDADAGRRSEGEGRTILEATAKGDEDVSRLLRQTNTEMEGPESKRRMSTLAHLKAAVAATVAELRAPSPAAGTGEPSRLDRYRADLAKVVRPRRPDDKAPTERPAPLVLVSEQRIDRPSNTDASPTRVMPRRISAGNLAVETVEDSAAETEADNIFASSRSFAEFAERLGATDLPDLLEAAAAYTACIEGQPSFSRPQLMRHVSAVTPDTDAVREDSMRSFGQLLRQGKIEKVKRGQFAITDTSYYLAEARRMTR